MMPIIVTAKYSAELVCKQNLDMMKKKLIVYSSKEQSFKNGMEQSISCFELKTPNFWNFLWNWFTGCVMTLRGEPWAPGKEIPQHSKFANI